MHTTIHFIFSTDTLYISLWNAIVWKLPDFYTTLKFTRRCDSLLKRDLSAGVKSTRAVLYILYFVYIDTLVLYIIYKYKQNILITSASSSLYPSARRHAKHTRVAKTIVITTRPSNENPPSVHYKQIYNIIIIGTFYISWRRRWRLDDFFRCFYFGAHENMVFLFLL